MTSLTDTAVNNGSVTRELSTDSARPRRRQHTPISPVSSVRHWLRGRLSQHFFRVPKVLRQRRLKLLAFMFERVGFEPGDRLMQQGDAADEAYLIIDGHAEVILETPIGPVVVATVGANEIVGEVGILGNAPRAWTLRIPKKPFMRIVREFPIHCGLDNAGIGAAARPKKRKLQ